jgi:putative ABC transport system substrate-binding protein
LAAKAAAPNGPIIFSGTDPVPLICYNRPCGNTIGIVLTEPLEPTRLNLLREMLPRATTIGVLLNPNFPPAEGQLRDMEAAARTLDVQLQVLRASSDREIDVALAFVAEHRIPALIVAVDPFFYARRDRLVALPGSHAVPTMFQFREFAVAGGLMSYGVDLSDLYRRVGVYVGRILGGATPRDLPVLQPTKFELVINLKTAKAVGVDIPPMLVARADEVIQ